MDTNILTASGLSKSFGAVAAVQDITFELKKHDIMGLIGPNGAGKTTLFNLLSGFLTPDAGTVRFDDRHISGMPPHKIARLGMQRTFQATRPLREETVLSNVVTGTHLATRRSVWASLFGGAKTRKEEEHHFTLTADLLARVHLEDVATSFPDELTAGKLRLLEIARCLAAEPSLILLDEPAAGLDKEETAALEQLIRDVRERGTTILIVEHDVDLVMRLCDHVLVMNFGTHLFSGKPEDARDNPLVKEAYFGATKHPVGDKK